MKKRISVIAFAMSMFCYGTGLGVYWEDTGGHDARRIVLMIALGLTGTGTSVITSDVDREATHDR